MLDTENGYSYREMRVASEVSTEKEEKKLRIRSFPTNLSFGLSSKQHFMCISHSFKKIKRFHQEIHRIWFLPSQPHPSQP